MTKRTNIEGRVMQEVVSFEKKRSFSWISFFLVVIGLLATVVIVTLFIATVTVLDRKSYELLALLGEDPEIIAEFWKDILAIFFEELPMTQILLLLASLMLLTVFLLTTNKKRNLVLKRIRQILQYN